MGPFMLLSIEDGGVTRKCRSKLKRERERHTHTRLGVKPRVSGGGVVVWAHVSVFPV